MSAVDNAEGEVGGRGSLTFQALQYLERKAAQAASAALSVRSEIVWGPSGDVSTWAEVQQAIDASKAPLVIIPESPAALHIPVTGMGPDWNVKNAMFRGRRIAQTQTVQIDTGAVVRNLWGIDSTVRLEGAPTTGPCLTFDAIPGSPAVLIASKGSIFANFGSRAMVDVAPMDFFIFPCLDAGGYQAGVPGQVLAALGAGSQMLQSIRGGAQLDLPFVSGPASAFLAIQHDGTVTFPFDFSLLAPSFVGTGVNIALGMVGCSGPTSGRPSGAFGSIPAGCTYRDTTIVPPRLISWNETLLLWVDAQTNVPV